jgi:pyruvate dehydrogenase E1 component beta subunit
VPTTADAIRTVLSQALDADPSLVLASETVGGVAGTMDGLREARPDRVLVLPIADRGALGFALGMALGGKRVAIELADAGRLPAVLEVLLEAGAVSAAGEFAVPLIVRVPYGTEAQGLDVPVGPWLADPPGVRVLCPSSPDQAAALLRLALTLFGPTVILEPRAAYGDRGDVGTAIGSASARVLRAGRHVTLAAWGTGVRAASEAAEALAAEGVEADVVDLVALAPLERAAVGARVRETGRLVVVHPDDAAMARRVREAVLDEAFLFLEAPLADARSDRDAVARAARGVVSY